MTDIGDRKFKRECDFYLDITSEVCPLTFVKIKLLIERMAAGQTAKIRLKGSEPLQNVPRSVKEHGHTVLSLEAESEVPPSVDTHHLIIRKN